MAAGNQIEAFASLTRRAEYQERSREIFRSASSLDWFIRQHRSELSEQGAIVRIAGEILVHEEKFTDAVLKIGAQAAAK